MKDDKVRPATDEENRRLTMLERKMLDLMSTLDASTNEVAAVAASVLCRLAILGDRHDREEFLRNVADTYDFYRENIGKTMQSLGLSRSTDGTSN